MAKKAKRRGRPLGSKNKKKSATRVPKKVAAMEVGQLRAYIDELEDALTRKITQQRRLLEGQLTGLKRYVSPRATGAARTVPQAPRTGRRAKAKPKYQSKKRKGLRWSGRGMLPVWMREEMKGTKLRKEDFLIR